MMTCFHCNGTGACRCLTCETGKCEACSGRKKLEVIFAQIGNLDVRDTINYTVYKPLVGSPERRLKMEVK
jgi:hypothetical protein